MNDTHNQRTLAQDISYIGIGLHTGRQVSMIVRPAPPNSGVQFLRKDVASGHGLIPARWYRVSATELSTTLSNEHDVSVATVEHLLAALRGCGVDNALVELDGPEVPIMDGSADPFVQTIERLGTIAQPARRHVIWLHQPVEVQDGDKLAVLLPSPTTRITVSIDFEPEAVGAQTFSVELVYEAFRRDLARARTFGFKSQLEVLKARGLALGGSLRNAILVDGNRIVNEEGLRYHDEFVRHKVLDCLGDLSLAGMPIMGHYYGYKPGHALNQALLGALFTQRGAWSYLAMDEYQALWQCDRVSETDKPLCADNSAPNRS